ncbi:MAG: hypothetical protein AB1757_03280 [Acidobacteriota bacterium]
MEHNGNNSESKETLYLMGGLALMVFGAGLVITHPVVRKTVSAGLSAVLPGLQNKFPVDLSAIGPDIQRYFKLREM